jgi:hypothetical protein
MSSIVTLSKRSCCFSANMRSRGVITLPASTLRYASAPWMMWPSFVTLPCSMCILIRWLMPARV